MTWICRGDEFAATPRPRRGYSDARSSSFVARAGRPRARRASETTAPRAGPSRPTSRSPSTRGSRRPRPSRSPRRASAPSAPAARGRPRARARLAAGRRASGPAAPAPASCTCGPSSRRRPFAMTFAASACGRRALEGLGKSSFHSGAALRAQANHVRVEVREEDRRHGGATTRRTAARGSPAPRRRLGFPPDARAPPLASRPRAAPTFRRRRRERAAATRRRRASLPRTIRVAAAAAPRLGSARAHAGRAEPLATSSFKVKAESDFFFSGRARARRMYARLTKSAAAPSLNFFIIQTPTGLLSRVLLVSRTCRIKSRWRAWETSRQKVTYPVDGIC